MAAFNSREEAEPLCARLESLGIPAAIRNDLDARNLIGFARPSAGVRVEVARDDFEAALQVVYDWNADEAGGVRAPLEWLHPGPRAARAGSQGPNLPHP